MHSLIYYFVCCALLYVVYMQRIGSIYSPIFLHDDVIK